MGQQPAVCQVDVVKCFQLLMNKIIEDKEEIRQPYQVKIVQSTTCHGGHYLMRLEKPDLNPTFSVHKCSPPPTVYYVCSCFETLPQILVIHLKRDPVDINVEVSVPSSLTLTTEKQLDTDYELFVVCHHSGGIRSDQYIVEIKSVENDCWYRFIDTQVQEIPEGQSCFDEQHSATTSLLLYHRVNSSTRPSKPPSAESMGNLDTDDTSSQGSSPARENEMSWEMENAAVQEGGSPASRSSASPVQLSSDSRKGTYVGLRNQGSTCYLNSLLQCLFFTRELREAILSCDNGDSGIVCQLQKLFKKLEHSKSAPSTKKITKCLGVRNVHQQQDVAEYFRILMNKIVEDKKEIQQHNALDAVQKVNEFTGDEQFYCETCESKQDSTSRCYFETLPQILVLNLKRYRFDGNWFRKLHYEVSVPFSLTVNSEEQPYELFAVCHHFGGIHGGHYVAEIKSFENECWYYFNDTIVKKMPKEWNTTGATNRYFQCHVLRWDFQPFLCQCDIFKAPPFLGSHFSTEFLLVH
ncbi:matrix metalloproteinase-14 [Platysternon megacephalum]|uniref:Ubiquitin carboxyl-terminal hydrolase n=1 Tax=Platysternon megacephalum TaxID=55544 RepID=A0A4D9DW40_9SAUR|nr:matrix metalloproteinase-14 [Platysternon megacephalum]